MCDTPLFLENPRDQRGTDIVPESQSIKNISAGKLLAQLFEITEQFNMATQPQLLLLQKTMVVVEGVARTLDEDANIWEISKPVLEGWLKKEVGPEAKINQAIKTTSQVMDRLPELPGMMDKASKALELLAAGTVASNNEMAKKFEFEKLKIKNQQNKIKHFLIDIEEPNNPINVKQFQEIAQKSIKREIKQNNLPFLVGGSGLYMNSITKGFFVPNVPPQNNLREQFKTCPDLWKKLNINYSDFIRTTEHRHTEIVQQILTKVHESGDIYMDEYEGWYSISEERFITEKELDSGQFGQVKQIKEKNYFFRMSKYQATLIDKIEKDELLIQPKSRKNEVLGFLKNELSDLCISRPKSRLEWGIELPFDDNYVTYVWFDALINYISAIGAYSNDEHFSSLWPADVHLIGKDILTTHSVYWPTMLLSLGLPLPQRITVVAVWLLHTMIR